MDIKVIKSANKQKDIIIDASIIISFTLLSSCIVFVVSLDSINAFISYISKRSPSSSKF